MKRKLIVVLLVGIIVRIFLAYSTYHSDTQVYLFAGNVLKEGFILNFYDYLWQIPENAEILQVYPRYLFNYPPLVYLFLGGLSIITTSVISSNISHLFIYDLPSALGNVSTNIILLNLKLPYILFDLGIGYFIYKLFKDKKSAFLAFTIWIFNPITLYATYMVGQFDVIPTFFVMMVLYLAVRSKKSVEKQNYYLGAFLLGIGAAFKVYPILFVFPLALLKDKTCDRIKVVLVGFLAYFVAILPFISSEGFRRTSLLAGQTTKSFYANIPVSGGQSIILYIAVIVFVLSLFYYADNNIENLWERFFVILVLFFVFTHFHPQWFVWITPFIIIDLVKNKMKHAPLVIGILILFFVSIFFFDPGLSVWLFSPIKPSLYGLPSIWHILNVNINIDNARSIIHSLFVGIALYYLYLYMPKRKTTRLNKSKKSSR